MIVVHAEMRERRPTWRAQPATLIVTSASSPGDVVVVVVPGEDADALVVAGRDGVDVGRRRARRRP